MALTLIHDSFVPAVRISDTVFIVPHRSHQPNSILVKFFQSFHMAVQDSSFLYRHHRRYSARQVVPFYIMPRVCKCQIFTVTLLLLSQIIHHLMYMSVCSIISAFVPVIFHICKTANSYTTVPAFFMVGISILQSFSIRSPFLPGSVISIRYHNAYQ